MTDGTGMQATPRETAFLICLSQSYELAGRKVSDSTIISAAKELAATIDCRDDEIKELFSIARTYSDIPTTKTLFKALVTINENRVVDSSNAISYDGNNRLLFSINCRETLRLLSVKLGKYADFCTAYDRRKVGKDKYDWANPNFKEKFENDMMPFMQKVCGRWLGTNPNHPDHPVRRMRYKQGDAR